MRLFNVIGLDCYSSSLSMNEFLYCIRSKKIYVYNVRIIEESILFESAISNYFKLISCEGIYYIGTLGILGHIRSFFKLKRNILVFLSCLLAIFVYSNCVWDISIVGEDSYLVNQLENSLKESGIYQYSMFVSDEELMALEDSLRDIYFNEIEWINVVRTGNFIEIRFMPRERAFKEDLGYEPLVARKEAVVAYFEVLSGRKLVRENDYVRVGDVLVSPSIVDSFGKEKKIFVRGRVFGKTLYVLESELLWPYEYELTKAFAYYRLLFDIRNQVAKELSKDEEILTENILQFSFQEGKIRMKVQYTLYEDITRP